MTVIDLIVITTMIMEAENQGLKGMQMVAEVLLNRTRAKKYSKGDLISTCLWPYAFSSWNTKDPNRYRVLWMLAAWENRGGSTVPDKTVDGARAAWSVAHTSNLTNGATHYYSTRDPNIRSGQWRDADGVPCPDWANNQKPSAVHLDHRFYAGIA